MDINEENFRFVGFFRKEELQGLEAHFEFDVARLQASLNEAARTIELMNKEGLQGIEARLESARKKKRDRQWATDPMQIMYKLEHLPEYLRYAIADCFYYAAGALNWIGDRISGND